MSEIIKHKKNSDLEVEARQALQPCLFGRVGILIGAGFLVIMAGIVIPIPEFSRIIDIGWIITVCLSAAVLMLAVIAKNLSELSGFASFVVSITLLRLGLAVASVKSIIVYQWAGSLVEKTGALLLMDNLSLYAVVLPVAVLGVVVMIFMATGGVIRKTSKYVSDTLPFKYISAEADFNASVISESQAADIKGKIKSEADFFLSMSAAGKFLRFDALVNVVIILSSCLGILASHASSEMGRSIIEDGTLEVNVMLTLGLFVVLFIPALILAFSSNSVVNKKNLRPVFVDEVADGIVSENKEGRVASDTFQNNEFELLNPNFVEISNAIKGGGKLDVVEKLPEGVVEDFMPDSNDDINNIKGDIIDSQDGGEEISSGILDLILSECQGSLATALLCSESVDLLAVSTAVNICVELADRGKKCLLIDADTSRNAVYKVFDIDPKSGSGPFDSCVDDLAVWSVGSECKEIGSDLTKKISEVGGDFDCIIIYAPRIEDSHYYGKLAGFVNVAAFATGGSKTQAGYIYQLKELLASVDCKCIVQDTLS